MTPPTTRDAVTAASLAATWELARSGGSASAEELAAAAGISRRTFHRYFPRKADCIRPAIADARELFFAVLADQPASLSFRDAWVAAFAAAGGGAFAERTRLLAPLMAQDSSLAAAWEHEWSTGTDMAARALLVRAPAVDEVAAQTMAAVLMTLTRLAIQDAGESGTSAPVTHLRERLDAAARGTKAIRLTPADQEEKKEIP